MRPDVVALQIVDVHVLAGLDRPCRGADRDTILDDLFTGSDGTPRQLVAELDRFCQNIRLAADDDLPAGVDAPAGDQDIVPVREQKQAAAVISEIRMPTDGNPK